MAKPGQTHRELCCLPRTGVKDISRKLPSPVQPSDYYPILLCCIEDSEVATHTPRMIKKDFRALGLLLRESSTQGIFSSILPAEGRDIGSNGWTKSVNTWLHSCFHHQNVVGFDNGMAYSALGMLASGRTHPSQ